MTTVSHSFAPFSREAAQRTMEEVDRILAVEIHRIHQPLHRRAGYDERRALALDFECVRVGFLQLAPFLLGERFRRRAGIEQARRCVHQLV